MQTKAVKTKSNKTIQYVRHYKNDADKLFDKLLKQRRQGEIKFKNNYLCIIRSARRYYIEDGTPLIRSGEKILREWPSKGK